MANLLLNRSISGIALLMMCFLLSGLTPISLASEATAGEIPSSVVEDIKREIALPTSGPQGHPLPLAAHWNKGNDDWNSGNRDGFNPDYQIGLLEKGHHILPWFAVRVESHRQMPTSYYQSALETLASEGLPFSLVSANMEDLLKSDSYKELPLLERPNFTERDGTVTKKASPFGPPEPWEQIGAAWANADQIKTMQTIYPNPPAVFFLSNNEHPKMDWHEADQSIRYDELYGDTYDDMIRKDKHSLRASIGQKWQALYSAMFDTVRKDLTATAWKNNIKFVGYNAFGMIDYARWYQWFDYSLHDETTISYWPQVWDGASPSFYVNPWNATTDFRLRSPQIEGMNWVFMRDETLSKDNDFFFELSFWDGHQESNPSGDQRQFYINQGQTFTPERYKGFVQFGMWLLRPRVVREFRNHSDTVTHSGEYFEEMLNAVDALYNNKVLEKFWRNGQLVPNSAHEHHYQANELKHFENEDRWFLLDSDANPPYESWDTRNLATEIKVFSLALSLGTDEELEWLVYAHSPLGDIQDVKVIVPGHGEVEIDSKISGIFYLVKPDGSVNKVDTNPIEPPHIRIQEKL